MKQGWEIKKLGEVCEIKGRIGYRGYTVNDLVEKGEGAITLSPSNIQNNQFNIEKCTYISWFKYEESPEIMVFEGDILFVKTGSTYGKVALVERLPEKATINPQFVVLKNIKCSNRFLYYALTTSDFKEKVENIIGGAATPTLSQTNLAEQTIPLPPLPEQQRIVSILDEAFAAIAKAKANAEQNLKNAKELFESYLQGVFEKKGDGWEERKVNEIGNAQTGTTPKTIEKENYGDFIPFIKPADVDFSGIGDIRYDNEGLSEIGLKKGRKMESGSILMVCIGATIGKVGFAEREVSCNQQINSLTVKKEFEPKFIYYAMTSKEFQEKVLLEGKGAQATLPIINKSKWENLTISFPKSKEEQQTIVRQLDALRAETQKLEAVYQQKIADLEELKKSILQKAFAGELKTEKAVAL